MIRRLTHDLSNTSVQPYVGRLLVTMLSELVNQMMIFSFSNSLCGILLCIIVIKFAQHEDFFFLETFRSTWL